MLDFDYESPNQSTNDDFSGICIFFLPTSAKRSQPKSLIGSRTMPPIIVLVVRVANLALQLLYHVNFGPARFAKHITEELHRQNAQ
jgi:hypothetical protein